MDFSFEQTAFLGSLYGYFPVGFIRNSTIQESSTIQSLFSSGSRKPGGPFQSDKQTKVEAKIKSPEREG